MTKKLFTPALLAAVLAAGAAFQSVPTHPERPAMQMKKLTPVLIVDRVEPCAEFWQSRLGFQRTTGVPHGDGLGFVILEKDGVEIMYQSRASVAEDLPALAAERHRTALYIEVGDLDAVERAVRGVEIVNPRRRTFYGMDELVVREPGGSVVTFAQPVEQS